MTPIPLCDVMCASACNARTVIEAYEMQGVLVLGQVVAAIRGRLVAHAAGDRVAEEFNPPRRPGRQGQQFGPVIQFDALQYAPLKKLKHTSGAVQSMSYSVFTDIFEEPGPRFEAFHGGFGLMNTQGVEKPAYFAYQFMNQLGATGLKNGDKDSYATLDDKGNAQVLMWDYTYTLPENTNNQQFFIKDLSPRDKGQARVMLRGLVPGPTP